VAPSGMFSDGSLWKLLGTVTVNSGRLVVRLTNAANNQVVADAVRIIGTPTVIDPNAPLLQVIDDRSPGNQLVGSWALNTTRGHAGDMSIAQPGSGSTYSTWTFSNLPNGEYKVWATWRISSNYASNAPYTLYDNTQLVSTVRKDQRVAPSDLWDGMTHWSELGTITITNGKLIVKLTNAANNPVVADAIRIAQVGGSTNNAPTPNNDALFASATSTVGEESPSNSHTQTADSVMTAYNASEFAPEMQAMNDLIDVIDGAAVLSPNYDDSNRVAALVLA
jgi:hypothetical protein